MNEKTLNGMTLEQLRRLNVNTAVERDKYEYRWRKTVERVDKIEEALKKMFLVHDYSPEDAKQLIAEARAVMWPTS